MKNYGGIEKAAKIAADLGAEHLVVGGGAKRFSGNTNRDYILLGQGLDKVVNIAEKYDLIPSFHPHLGTCVESTEQVKETLKHTKINLCPDTAHLAAGGSDNSILIKTYADRIKYIHLKDYTMNPFGLSRWEMVNLTLFRLYRRYGRLAMTDGLLLKPTDMQAIRKSLLRGANSI